MKKLLIFILCALLMVALPVVAFAEEPTTDEIVTETEPSGAEEVPETEAEDETFTEFIVGWVEERLDLISVLVTLLATVIYNIRKHGVLNKSIVTLNNNSVSVAENSKQFIQQALSGMEGVSQIVEGYKEEVAKLLAEVRKNAEEKQGLEATINEVLNYLKTAKLANLELSNEVAELLVLANIPNAKKEELYSRHRAAVAAIAEAETTEVKADDGKET
jgi:hypothetical protein